VGVTTGFESSATPKDRLETSPPTVRGQGRRFIVVRLSRGRRSIEVNPNDGGDIDTGSPTVATPQILFGENHPSVLQLPVYRSYRRPSGARSSG